MTIRNVSKKLLKMLGYEVRKVGHLPDDKLYTRLYPKVDILARRFYNIGAGSFYHPCWTNVDYDSNWYAANRAKTQSGLPYDLL